jgi:Tol biopolymer transport system component
MVPSGGGEVIRLTDDACFQDGDLTWIPDGDAVAALPVWTPPPLPELDTPGTADAEDILVAGTTDSVGDLFAIDPATGEVTNLTADIADQLSPAWSPDHTQIAFSGDEAEPGNLDLYVMNADGSDVRRLTTNPEGESRPTWSPDGSQIAFEGPGGVWIVNADGSDAHRIAGGQIADGGYPSWSPDGSLIAFANGDVMVVRPDGRDVRSLTHGEESAYEVEWSPDGSELLFTCVRDICVIEADGTGRTNLTTGPNDTYEREAEWSPDGTQIVFLSDRDGGGQMRLYVMDADGTNVHELEVDGAFEGCCSEPDW